MIRRKSDDTAMTATMTIITLPAITIPSLNTDIPQTSIAIKQNQFNICWLVVKLYKMSVFIGLQKCSEYQNVTLEELTLDNADIFVMSVNVYVYQTAMLFSLRHTSTSFSNLLAIYKNTFSS